MANAWGVSWGSSWGASWGDEVAAAQTGGGWLSEEQVRRHRKNDEKKRRRLQSLDETIERVYQDVVHPEIGLARIAAEQEADDEEALVFMLLEHFRNEVRLS